MTICFKLFYLIVSSTYFMRHCLCVYVIDLNVSYKIHTPLPCLVKTKIILILKFTKRCVTGFSVYVENK